MDEEIENKINRLKTENLLDPNILNFETFNKSVKKYSGEDYTQLDANKWQKFFYDPFQANTIINKVSFESNNFCNENILKVISDSLIKGKKVMIFYGSGHFISSKRAIEEFFYNEFQMKLNILL